MEITHYTLDLKHVDLGDDEATGFFKIDGKDRKINYRLPFGGRATITVDGADSKTFDEDDQFLLFDVIHGNLKGPNLFTEVERYLESIDLRRVGFTARISNGTIRRLIVDNEILIGNVGVANRAQWVNIDEDAPWRQKSTLWQKPKRSK
jgi:hypothetical protein